MLHFNRLSSLLYRDDTTKICDLEQKKFITILRHIPNLSK